MLKSTFVNLDKVVYHFISYTFGKNKLSLNKKIKYVCTGRELGSKFQVINWASVGVAQYLLGNNLFLVNIRDGITYDIMYITFSLRNSFK
jgi:hypothetical protein